MAKIEIKDIACKKFVAVDGIINTGKKGHDLRSALFKIKHIHRMLSDKRPPEDYSSEILDSFAQSIEQVDQTIEMVLSFADEPSLS